MVTFRRPTPPDRAPDPLVWSLPASLRWIDQNRSARYAPSGVLVGEVLRLAAARIEDLAQRVGIPSE